MLDKQTKVDIAAVLTSFAEFPQGVDVAESMIYLALGSDMERYTRAITVMQYLALIKKTTPHRLAVTERGYAVGTLLNEQLAASGLDNNSNNAVEGGNNA